MGRLFVGFLVAVGATNNEELRQELMRDYFSRPTRDGPDGVDAAVSFLVDQAERKATKVTTGGPKVKNGTCVVSHDRVIAEGTFVHANTTKPYDWRCFCARARYHVAPECKPKVAEPVWRWRWTLPGCTMPDPSPARAAKQFLQRRGGTKKQLNVLMLGLSFMGQPFQSLGCLYADQIVPEASYIKTARRTKDGDRGENVSLDVITKNNGQCLGIDEDLIPSYFPPKTHPSIEELPKQNVYHCSTDHAMFVYNDSESDYTARVCFQYMFNMKKHLHAGAKLPCGFEWSDLDVVLSIFPNKLIHDTYLPKLNAPKGISTTFLSVMDIYQSTLEPQLRTAYDILGYPPPTHKDLLAFPQACDKRDVHYALPGFTDHAVMIWFSIIATGLDPPPTEEKKPAGPHFVGRWT